MSSDGLCMGAKTPQQGPEAALSHGAMIIEIQKNVMIAKERLEYI